MIDKVAWIHIVNRKILSTRSRGKAVYYIPGGKRDGGETDQQTLIREIKEELSVDIRPDTIQYVGTFEAQAHGRAEGVIVRMACYSAAYQGELQPDNEIDEMAWFVHQDRERSAPVDQIILDWLKERDLID
jgi:8-oxo-dGTP pyrophosphatase MutT (NUDIX family)